jgi:tRNA threonylcarbamoyladenosine biosynthesis protein TsaB
MLQELLPSGDLRSQGVQAIAYGCGPGSFTGLRIAASAVQGLAFANDLPAIAVSTLACQAQGALRLGLVQSGDVVLSLLDARINEVYWALLDVYEGLVRQKAGARVCKPAELVIDQAIDRLHGVGSGFCYRREMSESVQLRLLSVSVAVLPSARDLIPLALEKFSRGETQRAKEVLPVYVREEVSWKKLAEQGKPG